MKIVEKSVSLPGGPRLQYAEHGPADGPAVLFLHGYSDSWRSFEAVLPRLPSRQRAIALSQRGHGDSERPATGYSMQDFATDVERFLDALEIDSAVVVGHSMGASVAQRFAHDFPARTRGLVLVGGRADWRANAHVQELGAYVAGPLADPVDRGFVRDFQSSTVARPVAPGLLERVVAESLKVPARVWKAAFLDGILPADHAALLGRIEAPTLLVCGDLDALAREGQEAMAAALPRARLRTYPAAGHSPHWEEPERFCEDVGEFVAGLATVAREARRVAALT